MPGRPGKYVPSAENQPVTPIVNASATLFYPAPVGSDI